MDNPTTITILTDAESDGLDPVDADLLRQAVAGAKISPVDVKRLLDTLEDIGVDPTDIATVRKAIRNVAGRKAPRPSRASGGDGGGEDARADHVAYWAGLIRGSDWPVDVTDHAVAAVEARGPKLAADEMLALAACEGWAALAAPYRAVLRTVLVDGASRPMRDAEAGRHCWVYPGIANATIGSTKMDGTGWRQPATVEPDDEGAPDTLADMGAVEAARAVAAGMLFAGRQGLIHGPAGGGKTTVLANVIARVTTGRPWLGVPTVAGAVVVVCEEAATWAHTVKAAGGDLRRVYLRRWPDLTAAVEKLRPVAVIVDTLQYVAHATGSAELDSAQAVDGILRPLERLCREYGCAVAVTDHEPWADPSAGGSRDRESGTQKRPRHSGAKVATADYILRVTTADGVTTISRGAKVRWGITVEPAVTVDVRGERVSAPAAPAGESRKMTGMDGTTIVTDTETYDRLIGFLTQHPNATKRQIRDGLKLRGRQAGDLDNVIDQAATAGRVERKSGPRRSTLHRVVPLAETYPPAGAEPLATAAPDPAVPVASGSSGSAQWEPLGTTRGTTPETSGSSGSDPIGNHSPRNHSRNQSTSGSGKAKPEPLAGAATVENQGAPTLTGPAEIPDSPPPVPPAEPPADRKSAATVETESGDPDRIDAILAAAEKLLGAPDMKAAAQQQIREQAGKDRCRFCGGPPPLELTAPPASLMLCTECAATHREMTATTPADLSARVDQHVGGKSLDELWSGAQETAEKLLQDDPELRRLALADPELRRFVH